MILVHVDLGSKPLALGRIKWEPIGCPPTWLIHALLFSKSECPVKTVVSGRWSIGHLPSPSPSPSPLPLPWSRTWCSVALVWAWLKCPHLWLHFPPPLATRGPFLIPTALIWALSWFVTSGYLVIIEARIRLLPYNQSWPVIMGLSELSQCHREKYIILGFGLDICLPCLPPLLFKPLPQTLQGSEVKQTYIWTQHLPVLDRRNLGKFPCKYLPGKCKFFSLNIHSWSINCMWVFLLLLGVFFVCLFVL